MKIAVAMLGARMHYAVPRMLHQEGLLHRFYTDTYIGNKPWLERALQLVPERLRPGELSRWLGRKDPLLPPEKVVSFDSLGLQYALARRRAAGNGATVEVVVEFAKRFNHRVLQYGLGEVDAVIGFNSAAQELLAQARRDGQRCIMEQTILPRRLARRILAEEQARWPGWEKPAAKLNNEHMLEEREFAEWQLADMILAGSEFVRDGLTASGVPQEKIRVVPYGVDTSRYNHIRNARKGPDEKRPLRILFAGQVGLRKGVPDLLHALQMLDPEAVEARFAGPIALRREKLEPFSPWVRFLGPVPRIKMLELFEWADVFVLPSLVEGSATVTYEALASGCPVIATPNAGTIVRDEVEGLIVPVRSPELLANAILRYADDKELLIRQETRLKESFTIYGLGRYRNDLLDAFHELGASWSYA